MTRPSTKSKPPGAKVSRWKSKVFAVAASRPYQTHSVCLLAISFVAHSTIALIIAVNHPYALVIYKHSHFRTPFHDISQSDTISLHLSPVLSSRVFWVMESSSHFWNPISQSAMLSTVIIGCGFTAISGCWFFPFLLF